MYSVCLYHTSSKVYHCLNFTFRFITSVHDHLRGLFSSPRVGKYPLSVGIVFSHLISVHIPSEYIRRETTPCPLGKEKRVLTPDLFVWIYWKVDSVPFVLHRSVDGVSGVFIRSRILPNTPSSTLLYFGGN